MTAGVNWHWLLGRTRTAEAQKAQIVAMRRFLAGCVIAILITTAASAATIAGTVCIRTEPIPQATVVLTGNGSKRVITVGVDGRYEFQDVAPGRYRITADLDGDLRSDEIPICITRERIVRCDVGLKVPEATCCGMWAPGPPDEFLWTGQVVDETGQLVPHALVTFALQDGKVTMEAELDGRFERSVPFADRRFLVSATRRGYTTSSVLAYCDAPVFVRIYPECGA